MPKTIDITGRRFGMFVAVKRVENDNSGQLMWECRCDCGRVTCVRLYSHSKEFFSWQERIKAVLGMERNAEAMLQP